MSYEITLSPFAGFGCMQPEGTPDRPDGYRLKCAASGLGDYSLTAFFDNMPGWLQIALGVAVVGIVGFSYSTYRVRQEEKRERDRQRAMQTGHDVLQGLRDLPEPDPRRPVPWRRPPSRFDRDYFGDDDVLRVRFPRCAERIRSS